MKWIILPFFFAAATAFGTPSKPSDFPPVPAEDRVKGRNGNAYLAAHDADAHEQEQFLAKFAPLAQSLQKETGVPASVMLAMATIESGFGLTRTATFANNFFGIKWQKGPAEKTWQLVGQPNEDRPTRESSKEIIGDDEDRIVFQEEKRTVNRYRKFATPEDSFKYLAKTLLQQSSYKSAIPKYAADIANGASALDAALNYALNIGQEYHNLGGVYYRDKVVGPQLKKYDLIKYDSSPQAFPTLSVVDTPPAPAGPTPEQWAKLLEKCSEKGYMEREDAGVDIKVENWENFPTKLYTYTVNGGVMKGKKLQVIMLNPSPERAAKWIVTGIVECYGHYDHDNAMRLYAKIQNESGFQFPVRGFVDEQKEGIFYFRDGIAAGLKEFPWAPHRNVPANHVITFGEIRCSLTAEDSKVINEGAQARPLSIRVNEFENKMSLRDDTHWDRKILRETYQKFFESDNMPLITKWLTVHHYTEIPTH